MSFNAGYVIPNRRIDSQKTNKRMMFSACAVAVCAGLAAFVQMANTSLVANRANTEFKPAARMVMQNEAIIRGECPTVVRDRTADYTVSGILGFTQQKMSVPFYAEVIDGDETTSPNERTYRVADETNPFRGGVIKIQCHQPQV